MRVHPFDLLLQSLDFAIFVTLGLPQVSSTRSNHFHLLIDLLDFRFDVLLKLIGLAFFLAVVGSAFFPRSEDFVDVDQRSRGEVQVLASFDWFAFYHVLAYIPIANMREVLLVGILRFVRSEGFVEGWFRYGGFRDFGLHRRRSNRYAHLHRFRLHSFPLLVWFSLCLNLVGVDFFRWWLQLIYGLCGEGSRRQFERGKQRRWSMRY